MYLIFIVAVLVHLWNTTKKNLFIAKASDLFGVEPYNWPRNGITK